MKPILISACLLGVNCKYSGGNNLCPAALSLREKYRLVPVCPEQLGGLSTPRPPAERKGCRVVTRDGKDVTEEYQKGAAEALKLSRLFSCEIAVLKARSPSCGIGACYDGSFTGTVISRSGVTAELLAEAGLRLFTEDDIGLLLSNDCKSP